MSPVWWLLLWACDGAPEGPPPQTGPIPAQNLVADGMVAVPAGVVRLGPRKPPAGSMPNMPPPKAGPGGPAGPPPGSPGAPPGGPGGPGGGPGFKPEPHHLSPTFELLGAPSDAPRSVVIISLDTTRADRLGVYGGRAETPTLTAFAQSGARFDAAFTHFPETCPAHWSMMSGVPPELHGNVAGNRGSLYTG